MLITFLVIYKVRFTRTGRIEAVICYHRWPEETYQPHVTALQTETWVWCPFKCLLQYRYCRKLCRQTHKSSHSTTQMLTSVSFLFLVVVFMYPQFVKKAKSLQSSTPACGAEGLPLFSCSHQGSELQQSGVWISRLKVTVHSGRQDGL